MSLETFSNIGKIGSRKHKNQNPTFTLNFNEINYITIGFIRIEKHHLKFHNIEIIFTKRNQ